MQEIPLMRIESAASGMYEFDDIDGPPGAKSCLKTLPKSRSVLSGLLENRRGLLLTHPSPVLTTGPKLSRVRICLYRFGTVLSHYAADSKHNRVLPRRDE